MQPKLKSKVRCADQEIGEVTKVIMDPLSHEISHLVVSVNGAGERQVSMGAGADRDGRSGATAVVLVRSHGLAALQA